MKLIDTHCHVQDSQYDPDRQEVLQRARDANVSMICVGTDHEMSLSAIALAEQNDDVWASVGLHPNDNLTEAYDQSIYESLARHPKVVAIGEIGLDYYRTTDDKKKQFQKERFLQQLELARSIEKPVIIHCRDPLRRDEGEASAHEDMITILRNYKNLKGVIHSFTSTPEHAAVYVDLGFHIGLNGIVTFARQYDPTIQGIPLENILLETDAPYLTPVPFRGKRNEPSYILSVAKKVAELKKMSVEEVILATSTSAQNLFRLS